MNILLCCTAGMSTSMLVNKMRKAAVEKGLEAKIWAVPVSEVNNNIHEADVMLLGPQVRYVLSDMQKTAEDYHVPVAVIDQKHYGLCNGKEVLKQAENLVEEDKIS